MSLQHHAAAAEEGKGAAGGGTLEIWGWWWWWRVQRTWLGRPLRPLPLPARGRDHSRFLACQSCRPLQAGGRVYGGVFLAEGRPVLLCTREDASLPSRHSLEFFFFFFSGVHVCVCLHGSAAQSKVHSQSCTEERRGSPCRFADPCA